MSSGSGSGEEVGECGGLGGEGGELGGGKDEFVGGPSGGAEGESAFGIAELGHLEEGEEVGEAGTAVGGGIGTADARNGAFFPEDDGGGAVGGVDGSGEPVEEVFEESGIGVVVFRGEKPESVGGLDGGPGGGDGRGDGGFEVLVHERNGGEVEPFNATTGGEEGLGGSGELAVEGAGAEGTDDKQDGFHGDMLP